MSLKMVNEDRVHEDPVAEGPPDIAPAPETRVGPPRRRGWRRAAIRTALVVCSAITAWHVFATFLWVAPPTPLRDLVPGNALTQYMIPFFGQSWSVFAPEPINGNYTFKVRAALPQPGGSEVETEWVDATRAELSMSTENLFPPRAANQALQEASTFKGAYDGLSADAKVIAGLGYFKGADWQAREQEKMESYKYSSTVPAYIKAEKSAAAYATQVAKAVWGDKITRVQFQVSRLNIQPFDERNNPDAAPQPVQLANVGWRGLVEFPGQDDDHFAKIFNEARARAGHEN